MAVVSTDFLAGLLTNFHAIFESEFAAAEGAADWKKIATEFPSSTEKESYNWLGTVPIMSEWINERIPRGLGAYNFEIVNKNFESTIEVDRNALEDDKYGMIMPRIRQLAQEAARYPDYLVFALLNAGHSTLAFDGTNFFADARTIGASANIDNLLAGAYAADAAKIRTGIAAAAVAMRRFEDDRSRPMNLEPDTIACAPEMEIPIRAALLPSVVTGLRYAEADFVKQILVSPYLKEGTTQGHDYYLLCCNRIVKPLIFQMRKRPEFVAVDKPDSRSVFMRRQLYYGVDARFNVGFGDPRCAVKLDCSD